jgi:protein-L-isoaspartate O-methyltransferase
LGLCLIHRCRIALTAANSSFIDRVFTWVKREQFLPEDNKALANNDQPLKNRFRTNQQPAFHVQKNAGLTGGETGAIKCRISGRGWTTALLSAQTGAAGQVFGVERIAEWCQFGKTNCQRLGNIAFYPLHGLK